MITVEPHLESRPAAPPAAPPSTTMYVPPAAPTQAAVSNTVHAAKKVELVEVPASAYPTQPSLKRIAGEPEIAGVTPASERSPAKWRRDAAFAALIGAALLLLAFVGRGARPTEPRASAPQSMQATRPAATNEAAPPSAAPVPVPSIAPAPAAPQAAASVTATAASAAAPRDKHKALDDPYDDVVAPASAMPSTSSAPALVLPGSDNPYP